MIHLHRLQRALEAACKKLEQMSGSDNPHRLDGSMPPPGLQLARDAKDEELLPSSSPKKGLKPQQPSRRRELPPSPAQLPTKRTTATESGEPDPSSAIQKAFGTSPAPYLTPYGRGEVRPSLILLATTSLATVTTTGYLTPKPNPIYTSTPGSQFPSATRH